MNKPALLGLAAAFAMVQPVGAAQSPSVDSLRPLPSNIPTLANKIGLGLTWGALHYQGDYASSTNVYARGTLRYNPLEWLAVRAVGGGGLAWSDKASGNIEVFDGAVSLMYQPFFGSAFRPYVATGVGLASIMVAHDVTKVDPNYYDLREGMRIGYMPIEIGLEYVVTEHVSFSAMLETYAFASDPDLWDGVGKPDDVGSFDFDKRDEIQRIGVGVTFYVDPAPDADKDGVKNALDRCPGTRAGIRVDATGCPMDSDGDRIADVFDRCPNTPLGLKVDSTGCPADEDHDGIQDGLDKCPGTPAGVPVTADGCARDADGDNIPDYQDKCPNTPAKVSVDASGCPKDADKDGVADGLDQCPNTPAGQVVDVNGCSRDADGDGVPDGSDKCGGTPKGTEVDSIGCQRFRIESGVKLTLQNVWFEFGKATLLDSSRTALARAATAIAKTSSVIEIAGFTDEKGSAALNLKLSQERAENVRTFLVALGVRSSQLVAKGYGETQPVGDNKTEAGRALNRRIEFRVK